MPIHLLLREHETPAAQLLFDEIVAGATRWPSAGPTPRPPRRPLRLVPLALAATVAVGGAAWAVVARRVSKPHTVACYQEASLQARTAVVAGRNTNAVDTCAELWTEGGFGTGPVPALAACVLPSGVVGVFPTTSGDDVCSTLGLAALTSGTASSTVRGGTAPGATALTTAPSGADPDDVNRRFLAFRDAVLEQLVGRGCNDPAQAEAVVRRELDRAGLSDWTVRAGGGVSSEGFSASRPCATLAFHPEDHQIVLVPSPPPPRG